MNSMMQLLPLDVEQAKKQYLAVWVHRGCGGQPVAFVNGALACSLCKWQMPVQDGVPLGLLHAQPKFTRAFARLRCL